MKSFKFHRNWPISRKISKTIVNYVGIEYSRPEIGLLASYSCQKVNKPIILTLSQRRQLQSEVPNRPIPGEMLVSVRSSYSDTMSRSTVIHVRQQHVDR